MVHNLKCGGCGNTIANKISQISSISELTVNVGESKLTFNYTNENDIVKVKNKLKTLGYPSVDDENSFAKKAKSYMSCVTGKLLK